MIQNTVQRLRESSAPVHFLMTVEGVEEWDRPGGPAYDPDGLAAMVDEVQKSISEPI